MGEPKKVIVETSPFKRILFLLLALFFFVLGVAGAILPLLPATPFFLLMSFFLIRVSPRLHARAMQMPLVGGPLRDWEEKGGVHFKVKILAYCMVAAFVVFALFFSGMIFPLKIAIVPLAAIGLFVVYRLPTVS